MLIFVFHTEIRQKKNSSLAQCEKKKIIPVCTTLYCCQAQGLITQIGCGRNLIITVTKYSWARLSKLLSSSTIMLKDFQILFFPAVKKKTKKKNILGFISFVLCN